MPYPSRWPRSPDPRLRMFYRIGFPDLVVPVPHWYEVDMESGNGTDGPVWQRGDQHVVFFGARFLDTIWWNIYRKRGENEPFLWGIVTMRNSLAYNPDDPTEFIHQIAWNWLNADNTIPRPDLIQLQPGTVTADLNVVHLTWLMQSFGPPQFWWQKWTARSYYDEPPFIPPGNFTRLPCTGLPT